MTLFPGGANVAAMSAPSLIRRALSPALLLVFLALTAVSLPAQTPVITQQPPSSLTVTQGGAVDLTIEYTHPERDRVCVEWRVEGVPILGFDCTNRLRLYNVNTLYAGMYDALIWYTSEVDFFSVTSSPCAVRILAAPVLANPVYSNQTFSFSFNTVRFSSANVAPMTNIIEFKEALEPNAGSGWVAATNAAADGNRFHFSVTNSPAAPLGQRRVYRVRVE